MKMQQKNERRTELIATYLTPGEKQKFIDVAKENDKSISRMIRVALGNQYGIGIK